MISFKMISLLAVGSVLAANYPPKPADLTTPVQQRIAIAGPGAMSIGWNTYQQLKQSCVAYGTSLNSLTKRVCSTNSMTYATSRTWANAVTLTNLKPATTYYYKIQSTNSSTDHFLSPRPPGDTTPFNMSIVIDLGVYGADGFTTTKRDTIPQIQPSLSHSTIGRLAATVNDYDFVLHPGDFAYADDWFLKLHNAASGEAAFQAILETFYNQLAPVAGRKAYMASPGNHEAACAEIPALNRLCPRGQNNFTDFMTRFGYTMPSTFPSTSPNATARALAVKAKSLSLAPFWYSFEYGSVHITMLNTETDFPSSPDSLTLNSGPFGSPGQQLAFLEADLASVDRKVTPWVIVAGHRPWYSTGGSSNICAPCQAAFEPLLYKYGVDLGIFGHVHNSQRFLPIYNGSVDPRGMQDPKAPVYVVVGGAGNIEGLSKVGANATGNVFAYGEDFSLGRVRVLDRSRLGVEFVRSRTGEVLDESVLVKEHGERFVRQ